LDGGPQSPERSHGDGPPQVDRPAPHLMVFQQSAISGCREGRHRRGGPPCDLSQRPGVGAAAYRRKESPLADSTSPAAQGRPAGRRRRAYRRPGADPTAHLGRRSAGDAEEPQCPSDRRPREEPPGHQVARPDDDHRTASQAAVPANPHASLDGPVHGTGRAADLPLSTAVSVHHQRRSLGPARRAAAGASTRPRCLNRRGPCNPGLDLQLEMNKPLVASYSIHPVTEQGAEDAPTSSAPPYQSPAQTRPAPPPWPTELHHPGWNRKIRPRCPPAPDQTPRHHSACARTSLEKVSSGRGNTRGPGGRRATQ